MEEGSRKGLVIYDDIYSLTHPTPLVLTIRSVDVNIVFLTYLKSSISCKLTDTFLALPLFLNETKNIQNQLIINSAITYMYLFT